MAEANLQDGVPITAGWFVINARQARWMHNDMRAVCKFGGDGPARFDDLGVGLYWIEPGKPMTLYHHEAGQEDFLVLRGECILVIDGQERPLQAWDFIHCSPRTAHAISTPPSAAPGRGRSGRSSPVRPAEGDLVAGRSLASVSAGSSS